MADWRTQLYGGNTRASNFGSTINPNNVSGPTGTTQTEQPVVDRLKELQKQQALTQLSQKRDTALSALNQQQAKLGEVYQGQRSQAEVGSRQQAKSFAEYLANRGLTNSGAAVQGELNRQTDLQSAMSGINKQEAQAVGDIEANKAAIEQEYAGNLANTNLGIEADYLTNLQAQQDKQQASDIANIGRYSQDYQAEINRRMAINPNDPLIPYLQSARQEKIANQQASYSTAQANEVKNALTLFDKIGYANDYIASVLGITPGTTTTDYIKTIYSVNKPYYKPTSETSTSNEDLTQL